MATGPTFFSFSSFSLDLPVTKVRVRPHKMQGSCTTCKKASSELKRCAKCSTTLYCSRDCQKADWKTHKKVCGKQAQEREAAGGGPSAATMLSPPNGLEKPITKPFTRLDNNTYLHDRPEEDVYRYVRALPGRSHRAELVTVSIMRHTCHLLGIDGMVAFLASRLHQA